MSSENTPVHIAPPSLPDKTQTAEPNLSRRKAVKLGVYAAYTAPVLLALLSPSKNAHAIGSPPGEPG
jgi:hypothetical protein